MAGGAIASSGGSSRQQEYKGHVTVYVIVTCIVAASAGLLFGYDNGIAGGVVAMEDFHNKFFPEITEASESRSPYCKYDDQILQLFVSSLFLAGIVGALIGSWTTRAKGRRITLMAGGLSFLAGSILQAAAVHVAMLILGRVLLGLGVGLTVQSAPLFLSEMAPYNLRGALNVAFQLMITIGILAAQLISFGLQHVAHHGWQIALGLAGVPAVAVAIGAWLLPETPNCLIEHNKLAEGKKILQKLRGVEDVNAEFEDICEAAAAARSTGNEWKTIIKPQYRPQLIMAILIPALQQLTGINSVIFYAPQLFQSLGHGQSSALLTTVIIGAVNVGATVFALVSVDKFGRRFWFFEGGVQMIVAEVVIGCVLGTSFTADGHLPSHATILVITFICVFIAGFAWSWGPLCWLVCTEVQPLETRSSGYAISVASNYLLTFLIGQSFLSMLCGMRFGIFFFFAGWVLVMTLFALLLIPETKGVPIEEINEVLFKKHWFWSMLATTPPATTRGKDMEF